MAINACIFCGAPPPLTKEHAWPDWLLDLRPVGKRTVIVYKDKEILRRWSSPKGALEPKCVCGACNSRWMSDLETKAKPLIEEMMNGVPLSLDLQDQVLLAAWSVKTAMVFEYATSGNPPNILFTDGDRRYLCDKGTAPPCVRGIWLAFRTKEGESLDTHTRYMAKGGNALSGGPTAKAYSFTIGSFHFVAQVLAIKPDGFAYSEILDAVPSDEPYIQIRFAVAGDVAWPPPTSLNEAGYNLVAFSDRFLAH